MFMKSSIRLLLVFVLLIPAIVSVGQDADWLLSQTVNVDYSNFSFTMNYPEDWHAEMMRVAGEVRASLFINEHEDPSAEDGYMIVFKTAEVMDLIKAKIAPITALDSPTTDMLLESYSAQLALQDSTVTDTNLFTFPAVSLRGIEETGRAVLVLFGWLGNSSSYYLRLSAPSDTALDAFLPTWDAMLASIDTGLGWVDLGDKHLHYRCVGHGSPAVIFEHGLGADLNHWTEILDVIGQTTRACAYTRFGLGESDRRPEIMRQTTQDQVDDLVKFIEVLEIDTPLVLVGHSISGFNVLLFLQQHPDWLAGAVLVDARHPEYRIDQDIPAHLAWFDLPASSVQATGIKDFGDRPLFVLYAGEQTGEDPKWVDFQEEYATYSTNSRLEVAEGSGHNIMMTGGSDLVIEAIMWVLGELQVEA